MEEKRDLMSEKLYVFKKTFKLFCALWGRTQGKKKSR